MQPCRTCEFAAIKQQQCRRNPPTCSPVPSSRGPVLFGGFPGLPLDGEGCGAHVTANHEELERREREHPVTSAEIPDDNRIARAVNAALAMLPGADEKELVGAVMTELKGQCHPAVVVKMVRDGLRPRLVT